jgi:hypothetical protein
MFDLSAEAEPELDRRREPQRFGVAHPEATRSAGTAADAENQRAMAGTWTSAIRPS